MSSHYLIASHGFTSHWFILAPWWRARKKLCGRKLTHVFGLSIKSFVKKIFSLTFGLLSALSHSPHRQSSFINLQHLSSFSHTVNTSFYWQIWNAAICNCAKLPEIDNYFISVFVACGHMNQSYIYVHKRKRILYVLLLSLHTFLTQTYFLSFIHYSNRK